MGLFSTPSIPQSTTVQPPPPPSPIDPALQEARRRVREQAAGRQGRLSTILTGPYGAAGKGHLRAPALMPNVPTRGASAGTGRSGGS